MESAISPEGLQALREVGQVEATEDNLRVLRRECVRGANAQEAITKELSVPFFASHIRGDDVLLVDVLNLVNNLCVTNRSTQEILFPVFFERYKDLVLTRGNVLGCLRVLVTCTQPGSPFRSVISLELLEPFMRMDLDDECRTLVSALFPPVAPEVLGFALENEDIHFAVLDLLHEAVEFQAEQINPVPFVHDLLELLKQPRLQFDMAKSKVMAIFAIYIAASKDGMKQAIAENAREILLNTKKVDVTDPILYEWSITALRIISGSTDE